MSGPCDPSVQSDKIMSDGDVEHIAELITKQFKSGNADIPMWSTRLVGSLIVRIKNDKSKLRKVARYLDNFGDEEPQP